MSPTRPPAAPWLGRTRRPLRPPRHPGQQRRHRPGRPAGGDQHRRLERGAADQPHRRTGRLPGRPPADEGARAAARSSISARCTRCSARPFVAAYAASKGGLIQLTKSLAAAWAQRQHPGQRHPARLDRHRHDRRRRTDAPAVQRHHRRPHPRRPLGRAGRFRRPGGVPRQPRVRLRHRRVAGCRRGFAITG